MISDNLIHTDISTLSLIYGEMKNRMYEAQCVLEDLSDDNLTVPYYEGLLDAYGFVYTEIDRVMNARREQQ